MTTTTTKTMAEMTQECKEVLDYCSKKAKNGIFYEGTLLNSISWNAIHKMYSRRDVGGYTYISLTEEEKALCNTLYREVRCFLKSRKTKGGYNQYIINEEKLYVTTVIETPNEIPVVLNTHEEEILEEEVPNATPIAVVNIPF